MHPSLLLDHVQFSLQCSEQAHSLSASGAQRGYFPDVGVQGTGPCPVFRHRPVPCWNFIGCFPVSGGLTGIF